eukprot:scaffold32150_cov64-Attheya_sp.AAC.6
MKATEQHNRDANNVRSGNAARYSVLSPCDNVRRSCKQLMSDAPAIGTLDVEIVNRGPPSEMGTRSVGINSIKLHELACSIAESIIEGDDTGSSSTASLPNNGLSLAGWAADGWHYTGVGYQRAGTSALDIKIARMERIALYVLTIDAINFCFWPCNPKQHSIGAEADILEYEHLATALRHVAETDDKVESAGGPSIQYEDGVPVSVTLDE